MDPSTQVLSSQLPPSQALLSICRSMLDVANLVGVGVQEVVGATGVLDIDLDAEVTKQRVIL